MSPVRTAHFLLLCTCGLLLSCATVHSHENASLANIRPPMASTPPSIYDSFTNLLKSLEQASKSLSSNYKQLVRNDTSALSNWIAYSKLLKPINSALLDSLFPALAGSADLALTSDCLLTLMDFAQAVDQQRSWAYRMLDSSGNFFPSGLMSGSFSHLGEFDQCVETSEWVAKDQLVEGKYCLLKYNIDVPSNKSRLLSQDVVFNTTGTALQNTFFADFLKYGSVFKARSARVGICIPSVCTQSDIQILVDHFLHVDKIHMKVDSCQTASDYAQYSVLQQVILGVLASLLVMVILATIFELSFRKKEKLLLHYETLSTFIISFSAYSNTISLMATKRSEENLRSINGIRVLTMCWLVYAHAYFLSIKETFRSSNKFVESIYDVKMYFILNAWPAVEVFFIISALIHSYTTFSIISSTRRVNVIQLIVNRVARMWPNLWLSVALVFLVPSLAQGPLWPDVMKQQVDSCQNTWWKVPLFVSNIRFSSETCQVHTWYLSADTQLYVLSFLFILFFFKYNWKAICLTIFIALSLCSLITAYFYQNSVVPTILFNNVEERQIYEDMAKVYMPMYFHTTPYLVGIFVGFLLNLNKERKKKLGLKRLLNISAWIVSLIITVGVILYGYFLTAYPYDISLLNKSVYAGFHRLLWSLAVSYLIFACENNQGGIFSEILSHPMFVPLSRLSYLVYLLHFIVTWVRTAYLRAPLVYSNYTLLNEFIVNLVFTLILAYIFHLMVESPFNKLYRRYIGDREWSYGFIDVKPDNDIDEATRQRDIECALVGIRR